MAEKDLAYYMTLNYPYELSREDGEDGYFAIHSDLPGCMAEGATADEAVESLDAARELWIETRLDNGYSVPEPIPDEYSGRVSLRMTPSLHYRLAKLARHERMSLNSLINYALAAFTGASEVTTDVGTGIQEIKGVLNSLVSQGATSTTTQIFAPSGPLHESLGRATLHHDAAPGSGIAETKGILQ